MQVAENEAAHKYQSMANAVDWVNINSNDEIQAIQEIIRAMSQFPPHLPIFVWSYSADNRHHTVADRIDLLKNRLMLKMSQGRMM